MDFYNQFDSLSEGDIQRIVQQIKAHRSSPGSRWVGLNVEQAIDNLAAEYNRKIQQMYTDVIINRSAGSDSFGGFVDYLARLHGIHRVYRQDVELIPGAGQLSLGSMAWNALVHQTIDSRILNWLEEWIFTSLSCILHCMEHSAPFLEQLSSSIDRDRKCTHINLEKATAMLTTS
ncbi:hypothetical protein GGI04_001922 [Coemansia thaxteri]|nr:hypothetical protein GGI04_001922 [Coemansia thaxteri]